MSLHLQLRELRARGITLYVEAGELRVSAPTGALDDPARAMLRHSRGPIIDALDRYETVRTRLVRGVKKETRLAGSLENPKLAAAETLLEDSIVAFVDGETSIDTVALAWKALTSLLPKAAPSKPVQPPALPDEPGQAGLLDAR